MSPILTAAICIQKSFVERAPTLCMRHFHSSPRFMIDTRRYMLCPVAPALITFDTCKVHKLFTMSRRRRLHSFFLYHLVLYCTQDTTGLMIDFIRSRTCKRLTINEQQCPFSLTYHSRIARQLISIGGRNKNKRFVRKRNTQTQCLARPSSNLSVPTAVKVPCKQCSGDGVHGMAYFTSDARSTWRWVQEMAYSSSSRGQKSKLHS